MPEPARTRVAFRVEEDAPAAGVVVLTVRGDADLHVAPELRDRLGAAVDSGARALVVDLSDTAFVDSMVLGVLLGASKRMRSRAGQVRIVAPRPELRRIFEITLLDRVLPLDVSLESALASAGRESAG
ncbi:MAG TPA: STAS domain-containing protein [Gaiellaceae bacterium]|nr:STAS domain-containing protein [Gaiellaceae bacterium]